MGRGPWVEVGGERPQLTAYFIATIVPPLDCAASAAGIDTEPAAGDVSCGSFERSSRTRTTGRSTPFCLAFHRLAPP
jgi:hypothetical protein